jgi:type II secretory pathway predicted ATPase ExeA
MNGYVATMSMSSTGTAPRRSPGVYQAIGLLDDPFPQEAGSGAFVALASQRAVLDGIRAWLAAAANDAPGLAVVAGAAGSGKTRLLGRLVTELAETDRLIGVVPGEGARRTDAQLLRSAIVAFGGTPAGRTGLELGTGLRAILDAHRPDALPPVLLIDNAALTGSQLEILRGAMTGPAPDQGPSRVQIVLFGPPELPERIARRRSLADMTGYVTRMPALDTFEAAALLNGRIESARAPDAVPVDSFITEEAMDILGQTALGNPGMLLALAHAGVREAIATGNRQIDAAVARIVTHDAGVASSPPERARKPADDDGAIQTRLSLPGLEDPVEAGSTARRRGRQR